MKYIFICLLMFTSSIAYGQPTSAQNLLRRIEVLENQNVALMNRITELQLKALYAEDGVNYLFQKSPEYKAAVERGIINWSIANQKSLDQARTEVKRFDNPADCTKCYNSLTDFKNDISKEQIVIDVDGRKLVQDLHKLKALQFKRVHPDDTIDMNAWFEGNHFHYTGKEVYIKFEEND